MGGVAQRGCQDDGKESGRAVSGTANVISHVTSNCRIVDRRS